jgi:hypothetical protein
MSIYDDGLILSEEYHQQTLDVGAGSPGEELTGSLTIERKRDGSIYAFHHRVDTDEIIEERFSAKATYTHVH